MQKAIDSLIKTDLNINKAAKASGIIKESLVKMCKENEFFRDTVGQELLLQERTTNIQAGKEWLVEESMKIYEEAAEGEKISDKINAIQNYAKSNDLISDSLTIKMDKSWQKLNGEGLDDEIERLEVELAVGKAIESAEVEAVEDIESEERPLSLSD